MPEGRRSLEELEAWIGGRPVCRVGAAAHADVDPRDALIHVRRPKDDVELERIRTAAEATRVGFTSSCGPSAAGGTEPSCKSLEAAFLRDTVTSSRALAATRRPRRVSRRSVRSGRPAVGAVAEWDPISRRPGR